MRSKKLPSTATRLPLSRSDELRRSSPASRMKGSILAALKKIGEFVHLTGSVEWFMEPPSEAIRTLLLKKKPPADGCVFCFHLLFLPLLFFLSSPSPSDNLELFYKAPAAPKRVRPEDAIPDYPQNRAVREYVKKSAGRAALGQTVSTNQCWRCKLHGHATGSRECPYFQVGNIEAEAERQVREDPLMQFAPRSAIDGPSEQKFAKLQELNDLMESVRQAERERQEKKRRKKAKREKKKAKKKKKEKKRKRKRAEASVSSSSSSSSSSD